MRKVILFIAMSLDGYIADQYGRVNWLNGQNPDDKSADSYSVFVKKIDTVLMGWNTYHQIVTELSPTEWVYKDLTSYVLTHRKIPSTDNIIFTDKMPSAIVHELQQLPGNDIWICGDANLIHQLMSEDLIDEYYLSVIPTILGSGIRLFGTFSEERKLNLMQSSSCNGIAELIYARRNP